MQCSVLRADLPCAERATAICHSFRVSCHEAAPLSVLRHAVQALGAELAQVIGHHCYDVYSSSYPLSSQILQCGRWVPSWGR